MRRLFVGLVLGLACFGTAAATASAMASDQASHGIPSAPSPQPDAPAGPPTTAPPTSTDSTADETPGRKPPVDVLQVDGLFDKILVTEIERAIERASTDDSQALILQVNSQGAVVSDAEMARLLEIVKNSPVTVGIWVGPTGARLTGTPAQLLAVADVTGMAPGSTVGNVGFPVDSNVDLGPGLTALRSRTVGLSDARSLSVFKQRISDEGIATMSNMVDALDGYEKNGVAIDTTIESVSDAGTVQRVTVADPRFFKLGLIDQLFHTVASPEVAYLLLLIGLALIVFEFYTAGVGIAAAVGSGCIILAATGLAALPTRPWAVVLMLAAFLAFAVDVQVGIPRFWTGIGILLVTIASFFLFEPVGGASLRPSWISLIVGIVGVTLTFIVGMPSMTRTRFATPTIGREWMIGLEGTASGPIDPDGVVRVNDAEWRARTNRATPLAAGEQLRVIAIDGVTLEVEPLIGAARDYREMRHQDDASEPAGGEPDASEPDASEPAGSEPAGSAT